MRPRCARTPTRCEPSSRPRCLHSSVRDSRANGANVGLPSAPAGRGYPTIFPYPAGRDRRPCPIRAPDYTREKPAPEMTMLLDDATFASPSAEFRPVPIWFWNGDLDEAEIVRQVRAMAEGGLGGFQIAARTGLTVPYLSTRWFKLVEAAAREAQSHGLQVWLADEYPYPSGPSGGEIVIRHPEYRAWQMGARSVRVSAGEPVAC